ncbi:hypothetical protein JD844_025771 [Phrynosoma platyrhinos]|uniref:Uncharacterized protein n=1 Tax=Phrynosoma platyrhinos TaxID=52577 RepID=A0ABQ7T0H1_PHRPL|nr:hypothetical protein JD844_025771 [Phrynosoma platyrhinos]
MNERIILSHYCPITELPPSQAIKILPEKLSTFGVKLPPSHLRAIYSYFHNTLIKHYALYRFVLTRERDRHQTFGNLEVYAPPSPLPLREGMELEAWKYEQKLAALSATEDEKRADMAHIRETLHTQRENLLQEVYKSTLQEIIQHEIQTTFEILQLKLQKRALILNPPAPYPPPPSPKAQEKQGSKVQKKSSENQQKREEKKKKQKKK